jgi:hypothetical protein
MATRNQRNCAAAARSAVHKHERKMHPGKPLTKIGRGSKQK